MPSKLFVGNLPFSVTEDQLEDLFKNVPCKVESVTVMRDRITGSPRGFGFVEVATSEDMNNAIDALNGKEWEGRTLTVNEARPREDRPRGDRGGFGGDRGGRRGGGRSRGRNRY